MNISEAGTPRTRGLTIDHNGNIVPKSTAPSRWANPRKYTCAHDDCDEQSIRVSTDNGVHNCCGIWHHELCGKPRKYFPQQTCELTMGHDGDHEDSTHFWEVY